MYGDSLVKRFTFNNYTPTFATFCISLSEACNLNCTYCFAKHEEAKILTIDQITSYLDLCFKTFGCKDKYYIDLSGKGEPLLFLDLILKIKEYCDNKSNELKREVAVRFVSNGTLLLKETVDILQKHGIRFLGVSLDGNEFIHDKCRRTKTGEPTYKLILDNVKAIEHHEYVGCAVTLTKDVFSLVDSLKELGEVFKTIGYKPARTCGASIDLEATKQWCDKYDELAKFLADEVIEKNNLKYIKILMNGEDYFGKFIRRCFSKSIYTIRCDGGLTRTTLDTNGKIYICPAASEFEDLCIGENNILDQISREMLFYEQLDKIEPCASCEVRYMCGGECLVEKRLSNGINTNMCLYKKHLIYLAMWLTDTIKELNQDAYRKLEEFCLDFAERTKLDKDLAKYLADNNYKFVDGKEAYDKSIDHDTNPY